MLSEKNDRRVPTNLVVSFLINLKLYKQMKWYKTLDINQRINLKDNLELILGATFSGLRLLFSTREIIEMAHYKLKKEGFNI